MFALEETYNQAIRIYRNLVEDIRFGRKLYMEPIIMCRDHICRYTNSGNIVTLLSKRENSIPYMYTHPVNVTFLSYLIGQWLNLHNTELENLVLASLLHDIGKAKLKDSLLNKEDALTLEEMEKMKSHPVIAYRILNRVGGLDPAVLLGVLLHHERMDGTGYPLGIKGKRINVISRIIAIADTFDAMTTTKSYRSSMSPLQALEEIQTNSFSNLDLEISNNFINHMIDYFIGSEIRLSNDRVGKIASINVNEISKPLVECENISYDLSTEKELTIVQFITYGEREAEVSYR